MFWVINDRVLEFPTDKIVSLIRVSYQFGYSTMFSIKLLLRGPSVKPLKIKTKRNDLRPNFAKYSLCSVDAIRFTVKH